MDIWNISYKTPKGIKQRMTMTAFSHEDAKKTFINATRVDNNDYFDCTFIRAWQTKEPTAKQKLGQKYGFILGCIKGAHTQFQQTFVMMQTSDPKITRDRELVNSQFAKLERDIRDVFKRAGLKVK